MVGSQTNNSRQRGDGRQGATLQRTGSGSDKKQRSGGLSKTQKIALQSTDSNSVDLSYTCQVILWEVLARSGGEGRVLEDSGVDWEMEAGVQCHTQSARHREENGGVSLSV